MSYEDLPGRFGNTRQFTIGGKFTEADAADAKESHVPMATPAQVTAEVHTCGQLRLFARPLIAEELREGILLLQFDGETSHEEGLGSSRRSAELWPASRKLRGGGSITGIS